VRQARETAETRVVARPLSSIRNTTTTLGGSARRRCPAGSGWRGYAVPTWAVDVYRPSARRSQVSDSSTWWHDQPHVSIRPMALGLGHFGFQMDRIGRTQKKTCRQSCGASKPLGRRYLDPTYASARLWWAPCARRRRVIPAGQRRGHLSLATARPYQGRSFGMRTGDRRLGQAAHNPA